MDSAHIKQEGVINAVRDAGYVVEKAHIQQSEYMKSIYTIRRYVDSVELGSVIFTDDYFMHNPENLFFNIIWATKSQKYIRGEVDTLLRLIKRMENCIDREILRRRMEQLTKAM